MAHTHTHKSLPFATFILRPCFLKIFFLSQLPTRLACTNQSLGEFDVLALLFVFAMGVVFLSSASDLRFKFNNLRPIGRISGMSGSRFRPPPKLAPNNAGAPEVPIRLGSFFPRLARAMMAGAFCISARHPPKQDRISLEYDTSSQMRRSCGYITNTRYESSGYHHRHQFCVGRF